MKTPAIAYLFFDFKQPDNQAWKVIAEFAIFWNKERNAKFKIQEEGEWEVILPGGLNDLEKQFLDRYLNQLKESHGIEWFSGIDDPRRPEDYEKSDFIDIVGDRYSEDFITNKDKAVEEIFRCSKCRKGHPHDSKINETLVINEAHLDTPPRNVPEYFNAPGLDVIDFDGGMFLSFRMLEILEQNHVKGFEAVPVHNLDGNVSNRIFLLKPNKNILFPCPEHTPVSGKGICTECGKILGGILNYYSINKSILDGDEIFSRHRFGMGRIAVSNRVYHLFKDAEARGLLPSYGLSSCEH